jgi:hypothetical protein
MHHVTAFAAYGVNGLDYFAQDTPFFLNTSLAFPYKVPMSNPGYLLSFAIAKGTLFPVPNPLDSQSNMWRSSASIGYGLAPFWSVSGVMNSSVPAVLSPYWTGFDSFGSILAATSVALYSGTVFSFTLCVLLTLFACLFAPCTTI